MRYSVAFAADNNYTQHFCVTLRSLLENNSNLSFDVYLLNEGLTQENTSKIEATIEGFDVNFRNLIVNDKMFQHLNLGAKHLTVQTFFRLLIPDLIDSDRVLYLDCDLIVNGGLKPFFEESFDDKYTLAVRDTFLPYVEDMKRVLGMSENAQFFNAGVMLINIKKWKEDNLTERILKFALENPNKIQYADQDSLNAVINGCWKEMPLRYNIQYSFIENKLENFEKIEVENAKIFHFTGSYQFKPWNLACLNPYRSLYWKYLKNTPFKNYKAKDYWGYIKYRVLRPIFRRTFFNTVRKKINNVTQNPRIL